MKKENSIVIINNNKSIDLYLDVDNMDTTYRISSNSSLILNIVDFTSSDKDIKLSFDLEKKTHLEVNIICINNIEKNKNYSLIINHNDKDSFSRVKVAGINLKGNINIIASSSIASGATSSDTRIEGKITNLSNDARSKISPILYIKENDVKASHSASLGSYNSDDLYYLTSRGITLDEAKKSITYGTIYPLLSSINNNDIKDKSLNFLKGISI